MRWREALIEDAAFGHTQPAPPPAPTGDLRNDLRAWVYAFLTWLAAPVTRAAICGLLLAYQQEEGLYQRLVSRSEQDVRALFTQLLASDHRQARADEVFDFLVATTAIRALTVELADAATFCDRTADALAALAYSTWMPDRVRATAR